MIYTIIINTFVFYYLTIVFNTSINIISYIRIDTISYFKHPTWSFNTFTIMYGANTSSFTFIRSKAITVWILTLFIFIQAII